MEELTKIRFDRRSRRFNLLTPRERELIRKKEHKARGVIITERSS